MSWNLSEGEQDKIMQAVGMIAAKWSKRVKTSVIFEGEPMDIYPIGPDPDAPEEIQELIRIFEGIISQGALAMDPDYIGKHSFEENE